jgi:hypothetical protein
MTSPAHHPLLVGGRLLHMQSGEGPRHDNCRNAAACIGEAAKLNWRAAHCPDGCVSRDDASTSELVATYFDGRGRTLLSMASEMAGDTGDMCNLLDDDYEPPTVAPEVGPRRLTKRQEAALASVVGGAETTADVAEDLGVSRQKAAVALASLELRGLVSHETAAPSGGIGRPVFVYTIVQREVAA